MNEWINNLYNNNILDYILGITQTHEFYIDRHEKLHININCLTIWFVKWIKVTIKDR